MSSTHEERTTGVSAVLPRLQHFVAVARTEHVTRAAEALGVPQPTLSRSVARLEADLGVSLFVRSGRTVRLTRAGALLLEHAERALAELQAGLRAVEEETSPNSGRVAFGFLHTLGETAVPALLREFRRERPQVTFDLVQRSHEALLALLRRGAVDLCLTSPLPDDLGLVARPMQEQRLHLVVPLDHHLADRSRLRLAEAADEQFVGLARGYGLRTTSDEWCRAAGFAPRLAFQGEDIDTVRGLVAAGLGVALLPPDAGGRVRPVVEVDVVEPRTSRTIGLVWRRSSEELPAVRAFRDLVLRAGPDLLAGSPPEQNTARRG